MSKALIAVALLTMLLCPRPSQAGQVAGRAVLLEGKQPARKKLPMSAECQTKNGGQSEYEEKIVASRSGGLANVFVYVSAGLEGRRFPVPAAAAVIDERGCTYRPHVLGMMVGQALKLTNTDRLLDNLHTYPKVNEPINITVLAFQREVLITEGFTRPEVMVSLRCDVHAWQEAFIGVLEHPFHAVTDQDGTYALRELPAGAYTITACHEVLGTQSAAVSVPAADSSPTADFRFSLAAAKRD